MKRIFPCVAVVVFVVAMTGCVRVPGKVVVPPPAPPVVSVTEVTAANASTVIEAVATLEGATDREIHSPVSGYVVKQAYQEGAQVREGDLLFEIDANPEHALPGVATTYTKITSPINGVATRAIPGVGDLIKPSMTLTTVSAVDSVTAYFALPEQIYRDHESWFTQLLVQSISARPENVRLQLEDGTTYPKPGKLSSIEKPSMASSQAPTATALFQNPDHILKPGQYARVRVSIDTNPNAVLVPQRCVTRLQDADQVMVVKPDNTVEIRAVTLGDMSGSSWIIINGLATGERVVVEGSQRCVPGGIVTPEPYAEPAQDAPATNAPPQ